MGSKYFQKLLNDEHYRRSGRKKKVDREAHRIAWTTPEDAYPAKKTPGLLRDVSSAAEKGKGKLT
jgi:hypothetical protein